MSDRHKADHEVFHVTRDMARWSEQHVAELAEAGREFGLELDPRGGEHVAGLIERLQQKAAELIGRRSAPGLLLLADLRHLYREAAGTSLDWELLAQGAQGAKNKDLLDLAERCHPQTLRRVAVGQREAQGVLAAGAGQLSAEPDPVRRHRTASGRVTAWTTGSGTPSGGRCTRWGRPARSGSALPPGAAASRG